MTAKHRYLAGTRAGEGESVKKDVLSAASALLGRPLTLIRRLTGGEHALALLVAGGEEAYVVRAFPPGDAAVAREVEVLPRLTQLGECVPRLLAHAPDGPSGSIIVTSRVAGGHPAPSLPATVIAEQMASMLARIHALDGTGLPAPGNDVPSDAGAIGQAARATTPTYADKVLTHRDYWCGNALWEGERLTGVVDWSGACCAPRGLDLAWCRQDLVLLGSPAAADHLLECYQREAGVDVPDIYAWDLWAGAIAHRCVETWTPNYRGIGRSEITGDLLRQRLDAWNHALLVR